MLLQLGTQKNVYDVFNYFKKNSYISVTDEPEHFIPFQESPQGSPPLDFQPSSCEGELKLLYITLRAETAETVSEHQTLVRAVRSSTNFSKRKQKTKE